jgi:hypothetical protein
MRGLASFIHSLNRGPEPTTTKQAKPRVKHGATRGWFGFGIADPGRTDIIQRDQINQTTQTIEHPAKRTGITKSSGPKDGNGFPSGCRNVNIFSRTPASRSFRATQYEKRDAHADAPPNTRAPHSTAIRNDLQNFKIGSIRRCLDNSINVESSTTACRMTRREAALK